MEEAGQPHPKLKPGRNGVMRTEVGKQVRRFPEEAGNVVLHARHSFILGVKQTRVPAGGMISRALFELSCVRTVLQK